MTISEDLIMKHLNLLLENSDPGDMIHHLHVVAAPLDDSGVPDLNRLATTVYAIMMSGPEDETMIEKVMVHAAVSHSQSNQAIVFAALSQEAWVAEAADPETIHELVRLSSEGRLAEHPDTHEATLVYAACRDGRRWRGRRWLTGPKAGKTEDVALIVGRVEQDEGAGVETANQLLRLVTIPLELITELGAALSDATAKAGHDESSVGGS